MTQLKGFIVVITCLFFLTSSAQMETSSWRFGNKAGIDFQSGNPTPVGGSNLISIYSSASVSDSLGNLLFYIRGADLVYNKFNDTMANGLNIGGDLTPQSGWIFRKSGNQYYIITYNAMNYFAPWPFPPMLSYSIVDMSLASGAGSVVVTNQPISNPGMALVSKVAVTKHCNGIDHWILAHGGGYPGSNQYFAYLATSSSVHTTPVVSTIGSNQPQAEIQGLTFYSGTHKFSPNGRKLAATMPDRTVEVYDFNASTGVLSNVIKLDSVAVPASTMASIEQAARSLEFSPDGSKLYVAYVNKHPNLCQFDLSLPTPSAIINSKVVISGDTLTSSHHQYALQLALDGKIYKAGPNYGGQYLGAVNNPNAPGISCNYSPLAVYFGTTATFPFFMTSMSGLPNFMTNSLEQKPVLSPITSSINCGLLGVSPPQLSVNSGYSVTSYFWNFGDPLSGSNTSTLITPNHQFSANGTYTVKLVLNYYPCGTDTLKQVVTIGGLPEITFTGKTTICKGESTVLNFSGANSYSINTMALSQNTAQLQPTVTTHYTIKGYDTVSGCSSLKSIMINVLPCTTLNELGSPEGIRVFPNPNSGYCTFVTPVLTQIRVLNCLGQEVHCASILPGTSEIDLVGEAKGIYLLEWRSEFANGCIKILID